MRERKKVRKRQRERQTDRQAKSKTNRQIYRNKQREIDNGGREKERERLMKVIFLKYKKREEKRQSLTLKERKKMRNRDNEMFVSFGRFIVNILWRERERQHLC